MAWSVQLLNPDYDDCKALLYGEWDLNGIAAIDAVSHAFVVPGMRQEQESNSEWQNKVELPKVWSNDGCKIALIPFRYQTFDGPDRISRDTGDWLSIADVGSQVNEYCVRDRQLGGSHPAGHTRQLTIFIYQPRSSQDRQIQDDINNNRIPAMVAFDVNFHSDDSVGDDMEDLLDEFADIFDIKENVDHPSPRRDWDDFIGYSRVGKSDPRVKNLGDSWMVEFDEVTSMLPVDRASAGLIAFYKHVVNDTSALLANDTAPVQNLVFSLHGLSLQLTSTGPIPWEWIIRFARAMSQSTISRWPVLYRAKAKNAYWNVALISAVLAVASSSPKGS
ncbi:MAG: hypothetical protein L6R37_001907 [Teloschistes peruensis]|nr:MAG: hypothetical protein L6R37_001907 [Teloschistes peruensis]